jgi:S1-C subfamily serine protease
MAIRQTANHMVRRLLLPLVILVTLAGCAEAEAELPYATGDFASVTEIAPSVVELVSLDDQYLQFSGCSGTIIDPRGIILTNFHCVADTQTKEFSNPDNMLEVHMTSSYGSPPEFKYYAQVVATKADADLAVLQIVRTKTGASPTECLNLPAMTIQAGSPAIEDAVRAVGYPAFGGSTLTVTDGKIAGLSLFGRGMVEENGTHVAIKTTTIMGHGISGGALINAKNELIGVPFYGVADLLGTPGTLNYAVAVNEATSIIEDALQNPKPGCDDAPPVALLREIKAYPTAYVKGDLIFYSDDIGAQPSPAPYMTMYFFAPEIDVNNMTLSDVDGAIARVKTDENGSFRAVFTKEQFAMKLGMVLVQEDQNGQEEILIRQNAGDASQLSLNKDETVRSFEVANGTLQIISELQSVSK